jgi:hypothetical protein
MRGDVKKNTFPVPLREDDAVWLASSPISVPRERLWAWRVSVQPGRYRSIAALALEPVRCLHQGHQLSGPKRADVRNPAQNFHGMMRLFGSVKFRCALASGLACSRHPQEPTTVNGRDSLSRLESTAQITKNAIRLGQERLRSQAVVIVVTDQSYQTDIA